MIDRILINVGPRRTRLVTLSNGQVRDYRAERTDGGPAAGDIFFARVHRAAPEIEGTFIGLGNGRSGLLRHRDGGQALDEGQGIVVQVRREPADGKDVRVTARPHLPGRLLAFLPMGRENSVSRRIDDAARRKALLAQLKDLAGDDGAYVARTAAADASADDLAREAQGLRQDWADVTAAARKATSPACLHHDGVIAAGLRDFLTPAVRAIVVDGSDGADQARAFCQRHAPFALTRIETCMAPARAFDHHDAAAQIATALEPWVDLPSGGWITLEATQALTAVDVNTGQSGAGDQAGRLWRQTNIEAAAEIARQLRLRDIAGNVVIDFIRMQKAGDAAAVLEALRAALAEDRADVRVAGFSEFGLVELTRQRDRTPMLQQRTRRCPACAGTGRQVKIAETADDLLDRALTEAARTRDGRIVASAAPEVIGELGGPDGALVQALFDLHGCRLTLQAEPGLPTDRFEVRPP